MIIHSMLVALVEAVENNIAPLFEQAKAVKAESSLCSGLQRDHCDSSFHAIPPSCALSHLSMVPVCANYFPYVCTCFTCL